MRTKYLLISISLATLTLSGTASATFQSINECVIDKFCSNPKNPGCHFSWNKKFLYCMKHYDFHNKKFNYDWDYVRTKASMKVRIKRKTFKIIMKDPNKIP